MSEIEARPEVRVNQGESDGFFGKTAPQIPPKEIDTLINKERASEIGNGPPLTVQEQADLRSWREFPDDPHYRELARNDILAKSGKGPTLSEEERADLQSKREFPNNSLLQALAREELLNSNTCLSPEKALMLAEGRRRARELAYSAAHPDAGELRRARERAFDVILLGSPYN